MNLFRTIVFIALGIPLVGFGLKFSFSDPFKDVVFVEGKITYYHFYYSGKKSKRLEGVIHLDKFKQNAETWTEGDKLFSFSHIESFNKQDFELSGGGVGSSIKIGVDRDDLDDKENAHITILQLSMGDKNFINQERYKKEYKKNSKYLIIFGTVLLLFGSWDIYKRHKA